MYSFTPAAVIAAPFGNMTSEATIPLSVTFIMSQFGDFASIAESVYDVTLFASGYEERATHIPRKLDPEKSGRVLTLTYPNATETETSITNGQYFAENWGEVVNDIDKNAEQPLYKLLTNNVPIDQNTVRMLVDYSSMSRLWYAALVNWARFGCTADNLIIDFVYSSGKYAESDRPIMVIDDIMAFPGLEGVPTSKYQSTAIFGLGFDSYATLCVLDQLESDEVFSYLAYPGSFAGYVEQTRKKNGEVIAQSLRTVELPLGSVDRTFGRLSELVLPRRSSTAVTLIPMGPKPHILAALLIAHRYMEVGCLRVSSLPGPSVDATPTGTIVATSVEFKTDFNGEEDE